MSKSPFGAAFDRLPHDTQRAYMKALSVRRFKYLQALRRGYNPLKAVIIGDKPGPGRPTTPGYHHTPFYATTNSSLWMNKQLVEAGIDENDLLWFNAEFADGTALDPVHLDDVARYNPTIICLGGLAEAWLRKNRPDLAYKKVYHPQFAKRFKSSEPYELIDILKDL